MRACTRRVGGDCAASIPVDQSNILGERVEANLRLSRRDGGRKCAVGGSRLVGRGEVESKIVLFSPIRDFITRHAESIEPRRHPHIWGRSGSLPLQRQGIAATAALLDSGVILGRKALGRSSAPCHYVVAAASPIRL